MALPLNGLFFPKSVAVVGASRDQAGLGHIILKNLLEGGYQGKIYPVNPRVKALLGLDCYPSVKDLPRRVDLAIIVVPAFIVPSVLAECGSRRIPFAIIITAGFRETNQEGRELEAQVVSIARTNGIRLLGPNCMGIYNSYNNFTATFTSLVPKRGGVSFISQSGAVGTTMLAWAKKEGIGLSKFVSVGNEADLSLREFLDYFTNDPSTRVITVYMESVRDGKALVKSLSATSKKKPLIVMKVGTTPSGARAASSHTGAMAVEDTVLDGIFRQFGVIRARDSEELFELATSFSNLPLPRGRSVAVVASGGGWAVESSDLLENAGFQLTKLPDPMLKRLDQILPSFWSRKNPVDAVASSDPNGYYQAVDSALGSKVYDMAFLIGYGVLSSIAIPALNTGDVEYALRIASLVRTYNKPLFIVDVLGIDQSESARAFERAGLPVFSTVRSAVLVASQMIKYWEHIRKRGAARSRG